MRTGWRPSAPQKGMEQFPEIKAARERAKDQNKVRGQRPNNRTRSFTRIKRPRRAADGERRWYQNVRMDSVDCFIGLCVMNPRSELAWKYVLLFFELWICGYKYYVNGLVIPSKPYHITASCESSYDLSYNWKGSGAGYAYHERIDA